MTCTVRQVTYQDVKPFVLGIHYARRMPCVQYAYGLFEEDKLLGVVTFGQPASPWLCRGVAGEENRKNVIELNRLVFLPEANGKNHASMLVGKALKMLPRGLFVVSYADWGGGITSVTFIRRRTSCIRASRNAARICSAKAGTQGTIAATRNGGRCVQKSIATSTSRETGRSKWLNLDTQ